MLAAEAEEAAEPAVYGELVLLGSNSYFLPFPTKYVLSRRSQPNGLRPGQTYRFHHIGGETNVHSTDPNLVQERRPDDTLNSHGQVPVGSMVPDNNSAAGPVSRIHFTMSKSETVVVDYDEDDKTDLFQIGRAESKKIDFRVDSAAPSSDGTSTVSRFAFRIIVKRKSPYTARIFAAGFDETNRIVLGENAKKWQNADSKYDGLVTNGILIMKPEKGLSPSSSISTSHSNWREVSVSGRIFPVRGQRWIPSKDQELKKEDNVLVDGTVIDICGATLIWRSRSGLSKTADIEQLLKNVALLNKRHIICPVQLRTLIIKPHHKVRSDGSANNAVALAPASSRNNGFRGGIGDDDDHSNNNNNSSVGLTADDTNPYCYLNCGHVASASLLHWKQSGVENSCPLCRQVGPLVRLQLGLEPAFYVDKELPTWCFKPCGHAASEQTVKYWSKLSVPFGAFGFQKVCPFCLTALTDSSPFVRLIFEED